MTATIDSPKPAPAPPKVDGARMLDDVHAFVTKYVRFASAEQADAVVLWIVHTHAFAAAETTPRLSIQSAEKQSGKTRLLEVVELLVAEPLPTASISAAAMFRLIHEGTTTLLVDEVDTVFSARGKGREELRGILNAGYRAGSSVVRVCGGSVERFPVFAPVALAGIGRLPDTVQDRSIVIKLKRRAPGETVAKLRRRDVEPDAYTLKASVHAWAKQHVANLAVSVPHVPTELGDRAADVWEPLLAIAGACSAEWTHRARIAAVELSGRSDGSSATVGILADVRKAFERLGVERLSTNELLLALRDVDAVAWGTLDCRQLAKLLRPFDLGPKVVRDGDAVFRGYVESDFTDAFARYATRRTVDA